MFTNLFMIIFCLLYFVLYKVYEGNMLNTNFEGNQPHVFYFEINLGILNMIIQINKSKLRKNI